MRFDEPLQADARLEQIHSGGQRLAQARSRGTAPLEPMQARRGQHQWLEQLVEIGNAASTDERNGTPTSNAQQGEKPDELLIHDDFVGRGSDLQKRAVDVEEERELIAKHRVDYKKAAAPFAMPPAPYGLDRTVQRQSTHGGRPVTQCPTMNEPFSEPVRLLLREHVTTFERLELLILLFRNKEQEWSVEQLCENLNMRRELAPDALAGLAAGGLVQHTADGGALRFSPATPALAAAVEELAVAYREESAAVVSAMSVNAIERIRSGPMRNFADAFVLGPNRRDREQEE
jgi:hypothetical protein